MKIRSAEYVTSGVNENSYPKEGLPEIAFIGRSNVGKSSLINALLNRKSLARTSSHPGKTRNANFYLINNEFYLVDLPGYGYAQVAQSERLRFQRMVADYLAKRRPLKLIIHLIDFRHPPTALDMKMHDFLVGTSTPKLVVANKLDKVAKSKWEVHRKAILAALPGLHPAALLLFSAETKQGVTELWDIISANLHSGQEYE